MIQTFFAKHESSLSAYLAAHQWPVSAQEVLGRILVQGLDSIQSPGILVDIPHFLVDAQRGLLCLDAAFQDEAAGAEPPTSFAVEAERTIEPFHVLSLPLHDFPCFPQQTLSQSMLKLLSPWLPDGVRLVRNLDVTDIFSLAWGNGFATLDLDPHQLQKLIHADKATWKRFLDVTSIKLRAEIQDLEPKVPMQSLPLFTSIGRVPSKALPLPHVSGLARSLHMFPSRVPHCRFTMTFYSYGPRLCFILSGYDGKAEQHAMIQLLLRMGWVMDATGE
jgi:hypothetical protein